MRSAAEPGLRRAVMASSKKSAPLSSLAAYGDDSEPESEPESEEQGEARLYDIKSTRNTEV